MSKIINWLNNREFAKGDYLGNLCRNNHEYKNTGKSVRCKPTDRKNGKCVCCVKIKAAKNYLNHKEEKKIYQKQNEKHIKEYRRERYRLNMLDPVFRENNIEYKRKRRREKGCELRENITLWTAIKNAGSPTVVELIQKQIKETRKNFLQTEQGKEQLRKEKNMQTKKLYAKSLSNRLMHKQKARRNKFQDSGNYVENIPTQQLVNRFYTFNNCCAYCGSFQGLNIQIEHVVPRSKGGAHCLANIIPACRKCNTSKFNYPMEKWYRKQSFFSKDRLEKIKEVLSQTSYPPKQQELFHDWQIK